MKRKGFTLVELLIVIVVIGILSAMMMMSSTEATTSAKASNIVSNLRNLKTAALAYYTDNMDYFVQKPTADLEPGKDGDRDHQNAIWGYLSNNSSDSPEKSHYKIMNSKGNNYTWWAMAEITGSPAEQAAIKKKLAARAKSLGLRATDAKGFPLGSTLYKDEAWVALQVR